jgi:PAS domain S-box-containing protein
VLGLEDCLQERAWPAAELGALRSVAGLLGATIHREQNERALRYSEALLRTGANAAPLGMLVVDHRTDRVLYANDRFCEILGITHLLERLRQGELTSREAMAGCQSVALDASAFADASAPFEEDASYLVIQDQIPLRDGRTLRRFVTQIRDADDQYFGRMYLFEDVTAQQRAEQALQRAHDELEARVAERTAELQQANSSLRTEIAERQRAEATLAQRESNFRALIENTLDVIAVVDQQGVVRYVSPSIRRVFQYEPEELIGSKGVDLVHPQDREEVLPQYRKLIGITGTRPPLICRVRHKDQTWHTVEVVSNNQVENPAVRGVVLTVRDISERRRLEEQFRQAQKMEAVGRLAGGVAHDFNNLLTVIRGYSGLMAKRMEAGDPDLRSLGQVQRAADRAAALVQQLLAFSRKQIVEPKVFDIHAALADLERMLRRLIGEDIELTISSPREPLYVHIDPGQFEQIVMNLSVNARDAMPQGGSLTIQTGVHTPTSPLTCRACKASSGRWAVLEMHDTGVGISEEVRPHIFEPFFTTKDVGKGTGLGLSMIYGAVEQAGGHVCVESAPGAGSTFRICLPAAEAPVPSLGEDRLEQPAGGTETILVVEDEELVRTMIGDTLRQAGYQVIEAMNGIHALEALSGSDQPVHLLLADVVMPRMSGLALAAQLTALRPEIKVLYISGHPRQELGPRSDFLRKPFTPEELMRNVRSVLDAR